MPRPRRGRGIPVVRERAPHVLHHRQRLGVVADPRREIVQIGEQRGDAPLRELPRPDDVAVGAEKVRDENAERGTEDEPRQRQPPARRDPSPGGAEIDLFLRIELDHTNGLLHGAATLSTAQFH